MELASVLVDGMVATAHLMDVPETAVTIVAFACKTASLADSLASALRDGLV